MDENKTTESYESILKNMKLEDSERTRMVWEIAYLSKRLEILTRFVVKMHGYHEDIDPSINSEMPNLKQFRATWELLTNMDLPKL